MPGPASRVPLSHRVGVLLGGGAALLLLLYAPTLSTTVTGGDSGEIATAVARLGVMHPTGYPLYTLLGHGATRLAFALEPAAALAWMNAVLGAGAFLLVALTVRRLLVHLGADPAAAGAAWRVDLPAAIAGGLLAASPALWSQVRIVEVYALQVLLTAAALHLLARFEVERRPGDVVGAALVLGLGAAHHATVVYLALPALLLVLVRHPELLRGRWRDGRSGETLGWVPPACAVAALLPLGLYAYLPLADATTSAVSWGGVHDLGRLVAHVTGAQYGSFMRGLGGDGLRERLVGWPAWWEAQLLLPGLAAAVAGLVALLRGARPFGLLLLAVAAGHLLHGLQYGVGDYAVYYLPALVPASIAAGVGVGRGAAALEGRSRGAAFAAVAGLSLLIAVGLARYAPLALSPWAWLRAAPAAALALAVASGGLAIAAHRGGRRRGPGPPALALVAALAALVCVALARAASLRTLPEPPLRALALEVTGAVPDGGLLLVEGDSELFPLWYARYVLGAGAGVALVNPLLLEVAWYREHVAARFPDVAIDPEPARDGVGELGDNVLAVHVARLVRDHVARRPLFERNVFTRSPETPGPPVGRPAAGVALLNRGPVNEILPADRVSAHDACARETLLRVGTAPASPARAPGVAPVLVRSSEMVFVDGGEGGLRLRIEWFEPAARGASVPPARAPHPRIRACFFDPTGRRIHRASLVATGAVGEVRLPRSLLRGPGRYVAQACVESADADRGREATCAPTILELPFDVPAGDPATGAPPAG